MKDIFFRELDRERYAALCEGRDIPLTQQFFYGEWQSLVGRRVFRYSIEMGGITFGFFQVIKYPFYLGSSYLYVPHGPVFTGVVPDGILAGFEEFARKLLFAENAVFLRFDPYNAGRRDMPFGSPISDSVFRQHFLRTPRFLYDGNFQPKYEWQVDLEHSEEDILAGMKKVNRYTVRQAKKFGVDIDIVEENLDRYFDKFMELVELTAERDGFIHGDREYYRAIFSKCEQDGNGFLVVACLPAPEAARPATPEGETDGGQAGNGGQARFKGEVMLINLFVVYGDSLFFLASGSENEHRRLGYTYLAQWEAMRLAKMKGLKKYNFGAVILDDNKYYFYKKWAGFSDFKRRFGGYLTEYSDLYDIVLSWRIYVLYILRRFIVMIFRV